MTTQIVIGEGVKRCKKVSVNGDLVVYYIVYHGEISNKSLSAVRRSG